MERRREGNFRAVFTLDGFCARAELCHRRPERAEIIDHRLVNENVTIGEKEDALLPPRLPQPPDDLKGSVSLAGACGHDEKDTILTLGYRFDRCIDGIALVITRGFPARVVEVVLQDDLFLVGCQSFPGTILFPQVGRRREFV